METYWEYELGQIKTAGSGDRVKLKLQSSCSETKWLTLTPAQFEKLEAYLLTIEEGH